MSHQIEKKKKIAVGLSGGVDSSVTAALLKAQGHDVIGVHLLLQDIDMPGCAGEQDRQDALKVAKELKIPFRSIDFRGGYKVKVIDRFVAEYQVGRTPNPDIWCNEEIKFGLFMDFAFRELEVEKIATGHYAKINIFADGGCRLIAGVDDSKDQSYFLYRLTKEQLRKSLFPLGKITKNQVRELAQQFGLPNAQKPDSVGICFIGNVDIRDFLEERINFTPGEVVNTKGVVIGKHQGVQFYTLGQRHGFTLKDYHGLPLYVIDKNIESNRLVVGRDEESEVSEFTLRDVVSLDFPFLKKVSPDVKVRIRHLGNLVPSRLVFDDKEIDVAKCILRYPIRAVAPGQHAVFYYDQEVVGGGVIDRFFPDGKMSRG